jgi:hypothetical protein
MKTPPRQYSDHEAHRMTEDFIANIRRHTREPEEPCCQM